MFISSLFHKGNQIPDSTNPEVGKFEKSQALQNARQELLQEAANGGTLVMSTDQSQRISNEAATKVNESGSITRTEQEIVAGAVTRALSNEANTHHSTGEPVDINHRLAA